MIRSSYTAVENVLLLHLMALAGGRFERPADSRVEHGEQLVK
jgi:hypothetical protein